MRIAGLLLILFLCGCGKSGPPYSAQDALKSFRIQPGYRVELFAAEPDVVDPVAMEVDEAGRIYVVEDSGYPLNTGKVGKVKLLVDTDGDGRPDRTTVFADHLTLPTGVMRWKKGILVTDAPDVIYLEDTDGDGKADIRRVVLTGFPLTNPQHTVNGPVFGLDNWIHLAHENATTAVIFKEQFGDTGSDIRYPEHPETALKVRGRNIRFRPDTWQLEARSGSSQFGHAFDEWGHHFTMNNSNHLRHEVIAARYLRRNPDLPVMNAMQDLSDHGNGAEVYPITRNPRYEMLTEVGTMTSACGLTLFQGASFVAEPVHGLVHRDLWKPAGASFSASRAYQREEFLASTDAWFRPVNFYVGPDGALYLMDYYRLSIEHPEWMSTHTHNSPDLYEGNDRGRIYRIVPEGGSPADRNLRLGEAPDEELVKQLGNANPWWRRNAQRLLMDRKSVAAAPLLERMAREDASAVARLHALWTLDGLGKLDRGLIERALNDPNPGVRENAIILGEAHLPALGAKLIAMASDADPRVEFQLLCTLGFIDSAASRAARDGLLSRRLEDRWMQIAALSASSGDAPRLYEWAQAGAPSEGRTNLIRLAASVIGERQRPAELRKVLASPTAAGLEGLAMGLRAKRGPGAQTMALGQEALLKVFDGDDAPLRKAVLRLLEVTGLPSRAAAGAAARAFDAQAKPDQRADALGLLALADPKPHEAMLRKLVDPGQPEAVQAAAIHALGVIPGEEIGKFLLSKWKTLTAPARSEAADALLNENGRARLLVAAIKDGQVQPWNLVFRHKRRLQMHRDPEIRETARPLLEPKAGEREKVVAQYQPAAERKGDTARGQAVFKEVCAKCHKHNGVGADVGPDLGSVRNRSKQSLLEEILMPNKSISQNYEAYVIETTSGATREGVMGPQTSTTITLRHEDGKEDVIQRSNIKSMYVTNLSAMPADLEHQISVQQMGDLLEYLTR